MADLCLIPQVDNARRLKVPLDKFPKIVAIEAACLALPAFDRARPGKSAGRGVIRMAAASFTLWSPFHRFIRANAGTRVGIQCEYHCAAPGLVSFLR